MSWDGSMHKKYRVEHTDGTPLKGKSYFVLRLDSDNPVEAARVTAAMRVYKGRLRNCDVGTAEEQVERFEDFCDAQCQKSCTSCPVYKKMTTDIECFAKWSQMPYEQEGDTI